MDNHSLIGWSVRDGIGHVVLDNAARSNAIDLPMARALAQALHAVGAADIGAILLSAEGRNFCVGGDIAAFACAMNTADGLQALITQIVDALHPAIHALATVSVPVVCALQGAVAGAGIGLALCADFVLAARTAKLCGGYAAIGLSPDAGGSLFLARRAGVLRARQILMTNRLVAADECLQFGIFDELHEAASLHAAGLALAQRLAAAPRQSMVAIKRLTGVADADKLARQLDLERAALLSCAASNAVRQRLTSFLHKPSHEKAAT